MNENEAGDARAMRLLVEEIRDGELPDVDWARVERRLFDRIDAHEKLAREARARSGPSVLGTAFAFAAVAAAIALGVGSSPSAPSRATSVIARPTGAATVALSRGEVIDASEHAVTFDLPGALRWTLSAGGRAVVREAGAREASGTIVGQVIALERGSIEAEVTPLSPREGIAEAFAVEAGATRVAVHGTSFSVALRDGELVVDLRHGSVAVGPARRVGPTTGRVLLAPARAAFSLDGGSRARWLPVQDSLAVESAEPEAPPSAVAAGDAPLAELAPPAPSPLGATNVASTQKPQPATQRAPEPATAPSAHGAAPMTVAAARAQLTACFASTYGTLPKGASIVSTLSLTLGDDGQVRGARFDPPLRSDFQQCAWISGTFATERGTLRIPVAFGQ